MTVQTHVLTAALRICRGRTGWSFRPFEIVQALPDLNAGSVRTHVMSRCCVNAPQNHPHRWPYFRRIGRGVYEVLPEHRRRRAPAMDLRESSRRYLASADFLDPVVDAYQKDIDRSAIRKNLRLTPEQRLLEHQQWLDATERIRGAARNRKTRTAR